MKVLLVGTKQDRLQRGLSNKKVLTMRRRSYQLPNFAIFKSYLPLPIIIATLSSTLTR